jgi:hypothetical protein
MSSTGTFSSTYSIIDVGKVVDRFAADFAMLGQSTGCETDAGRIADVVYDVKLMAQRDYIEHVDIVLLNVAGKEVRAARYTPSTDASMWSSDRPGNNLWPRTIGGSLTVVVSYSGTWNALSDQAKHAFHTTECRRSWGPTSVDTSYPGMTGRFDRRYSSNAYGMERTVFEGSGS